MIVKKIPGGCFSKLLEDQYDLLLYSRASTSTGLGLYQILNDADIAGYSLTGTPYQQTQGAGLAFLKLSSKIKDWDYVT